MLFHFKGFLMATPRPSDSNQVQPIRSALLHSMPPSNFSAQVSELLAKLITAPREKTWHRALWPFVEKTAAWNIGDNIGDSGCGSGRMWRSCANPVLHRHCDPVETFCHNKPPQAAPLMVHANHLCNCSNRCRSWQFDNCCIIIWRLFHCHLRFTKK